jgi:trimeric autotransporter adhesin
MEMPWTPFPLVCFLYAFVTLGRGGVMKSLHLSSVRGTLLAATALGSVLAASIGVPPAQAQFVCGGSTAGGEPQTGAGADATGSAGNVACGPLANASGISFGNTATGFQANASGNASASNIATGFQADASGDGSRNIATGTSANASGSGPTGSFNIATGTNSNASGDNAYNIALGSRATGPVAFLS